MNSAGNGNQIPRLSLQQGLELREKFYCLTPGGEIAMWLRKRTASRSLVVTFHGAVDRTRRATPVFMRAFPVSGNEPNQLMIADPGMDIPGECTLAWYAGHESFRVQKDLLDIIKQTIEYLQAEQVIFVGSSGGGFASLYYSWHIPGSVCLIASPQTNILKYYSSHLKRYMAACWPSLPDSESLQGIVCTDVVSLYKQSVPNTVILLHSSGDAFHLANHVAPFVKAVTARDKSRLVLQCGYWGIPDHSGSVPVGEVTRWLSTVLAHPNATVPELLTAWHASELGPLTSLPVRQVSEPSGRKGNTPEDLRVANALAASMLADR